MHGVSGQSAVYTNIGLWCVCSTLYDVFVNVRDDEGEHVKTMTACADSTIVESLKELHDNPVKPLDGKKENEPVSMDSQKMDNKSTHL